MTTIVRRLSIGLSALSIAIGMLPHSVLSQGGIHISSPEEFRGWMIAGMPLVLWLSYVWLNRQPANTALVAGIHSVGLLALFSAPLWWLLRQMP